MRRVAVVTALFVIAACDRSAERASWDRRGVDDVQGGHVTAPVPLTTTLQAGRVLHPPETRNPFADAVAEGERYYQAFNCHGCHGALGGGGIGPPLARGNFIYGNAPANIFQSIIQGRPYGMPAFGGKAPDDVIWKIAAYVRSMSAPGSPDPTSAEGPSAAADASAGR